MPDTFAITVGFIVVAAVLGMFLKGRSRDRCLRDFSGYPVSIERVKGKPIYGTLFVETTGLEISYRAEHVDAQGHIEKSFILYKGEYSDIWALVRYQDELDDRQTRARERELARTYHPSATRRYRRKTRNFFNTVRDSVMEISGLVVGRMKGTALGGTVLGSQDKYISKIQKGVIDTAATSFEPLLERHIGRKVVLDVVKDDGIVEYVGVLKEYTAEFVELMDVDFAGATADSPRRADLVLPRKLAVVRHLGE